MPKYSVNIEGRGFPARVLKDATSDLGFYALRFVEAESPSKAELAAVEMIKNEYLPLVGERLPEEAIPTLHLDEIKELIEFPESYNNSGAAWFPMAS